jgi:hypothetical protein
VEDRIKKRMSMRYGDDPSGGGRSRSGGRGGGGDIPDVPPIPGQRSERRKDRDIQEDPRAVDIDILEQENFDPEACTSQISVVGIDCILIKHRFTTQVDQLHGSRVEATTGISCSE